MTIAAFADANSAKASFDNIYLKDDPRDYFSVLGSLDYSIPDLARPIIRQITAAWRREARRSATMLDLGASYGINAALFRYPLTFDMLCRRYARPEMLTLSSPDLRALDRAYFKSWPRAHADRLIALDVSGPAMRYAVEVGIVETGLASDLERCAPDRDLAKALADIDIIVSTGCIGYVTDKTFKAILDSTDKQPWVVSFCLRMFDYGPIADVLAQAGLVTEKLNSATFVQRRFHDGEEAARVLDVLDARGLDPTGLEAEGLLYAELFVSRPAAAAQSAPLEELVTVTSGRNMNFGPRLLRLTRNGRSELAPVRG